MGWKTSKMVAGHELQNLPVPNKAVPVKVLVVLGMLTLLSGHNLGAQQFFQQNINLSPVPDPNASVQMVAPVEVETNEDFESYNRGPLHEAFATPSSDTPVEGMIINKQPPELVNELIPEERPDGESVVWIPGYWSYDDDLEDFLWITGVWRDIPPGMRWVPGYWEEVEGGFRWVSGLWMPIETAEIEYVPNPPESLEIGPSSIPPNENYCWIPGNWSYINTSYSWNPGYWAPPRNDYCWAPPRYIYTSSGCIYSPGYWDYVPYRRGLVFAPIRWFRPNRIIGVNYRPRIVINTWRNFYSTLFVCNRRGHYAYGNYFGPRFVDRGFIHLSNFNGNRRGFYDPLYNYNRARFGNTFTTQLSGWNSYFEGHENDRPRLTFREEIQLRQLQPERSRIVPFTITNDLRQVVQRRETPVQINVINNEQLVVVNRVNNELRELSRERQQIEARDVRLTRIKQNNDNAKVVLPGEAGGGNLNINPDVVNKLPTGDPANNISDLSNNKDSKLPGRDNARDNNLNDKKPDIVRPKLSLANNKGLINEQIKQKNILIQEQTKLVTRLKPADTNNNPSEKISTNDILPKVDGNRNNNVSVDANSRLRVKTGGTDPAEKLTIKEKRELANQNPNPNSTLNPVIPENNNNSRVIRNNDVTGNPGMNNPRTNSSVIKNPEVTDGGTTTNPNPTRIDRGQGNKVGVDNTLPGKNGSTDPSERLTIKERRELEKQNTNPTGNLNPTIPGTNSNNNSRVIRGNDNPGIINPGINNPGSNGTIINNPGLNNDANSNRNNPPRSNRGQENSGTILNNPTTIPGISPPNQTNNNSGINSGGNKGPSPSEIRRIERQAPPPTGNSNSGNTRNVVPNTGSTNPGVGGSTNSAPRIDPPKTPSAAEIRRTERQNSPPPATSSGSASGNPPPPRESKSNKSSESNSSRGESRKKER